MDSLTQPKLVEDFEFYKLIYGSSAELAIVWLSLEIAAERGQ